MAPDALISGLGMSTNPMAMAKFLQSLSGANNFTGLGGFGDAMDFGFSMPWGSSFGGNDYLEKMQENYEKVQKEAEAKAKKAELKEKREAIRESRKAIKALAEENTRLEKTTKENKEKVESANGTRSEKIGFMRGLFGFGKGLVKSVTGMFTDEKGKFSPGKTLATVVTGVAVAGICIATGGAAVPFFVAAGVGMGSLGVINGASKYSNAKTAAEKEKALETMGEGAGTIGLSLLGRLGKFRKPKMNVKNLVGEINEARPKHNYSLNSEGKKVFSFDSAGKLQRTTIKNTQLETAIAALEKSKGRGKAYQAALEDIKTISKRDPELKGVFEAVSKQSKTPSGIKAETVEKAGQIQEIKGSVTKEEIATAVGKLEKASSKKEALKAIDEMLELINKANKSENTAIEMELINAKRALESRGVFKNLFSSETVQANRANIWKEQKMAYIVKGPVIMGTVAGNGFNIIAPAYQEYEKELNEETKKAQKEQLSQIEKEAEEGKTKLKDAKRQVLEQTADALGIEDAEDLTDSQLVAEIKKAETKVNKDYASLLTLTASNK